MMKWMIILSALLIAGCTTTIDFRENGIDVKGNSLGGIKASQEEKEGKKIQTVEKSGWLNLGSWSIVKVGI